MTISTDLPDDPKPQLKELAADILAGTTCLPMGFASNFTELRRAIAPEAYAAVEAAGLRPSDTDPDTGASVSSLLWGLIYEANAKRREQASVAMMNLAGAASGM